jgi:hypothetical protein
MKVFFVISWFRASVCDIYRVTVIAV